MEIINKSQFTFTKDIAGTPVFEYGEVKQFQDLSTEILFTGDKLEDVTVTVTCGCTVAQAEKIPAKKNTWKAIVKYKAETLGTFSKVVIVNHKEKGINHQTRIKLKGNVTQ